MSPFVIRANLIFPLLLLLLQLASSVPVPTTASSSNNMFFTKDGEVSSNASDSNPIDKKEGRIINGETVRACFVILLLDGFHLCMLLCTNFLVPVTTHVVS